MNKQQKIEAARSLLVLGVTKSKDLQQRLEISDERYFRRIMHAVGARCKKVGHFGIEQYWEWSFRNDLPPSPVKNRVPVLRNEKLLELLRVLASDGPISTKEITRKLDEDLGIQVANVSRLAKRAGLVTQQIRGKGNHSGWEWRLPEKEIDNYVGQEFSFKGQSDLHNYS